MAYIKYKNLEFKKFMADISLEFFQKYACTFMLFLDRETDSTNFSETEFVKYAQDIKISGSLNNYKFDFALGKNKVNCGIQIRLNGLPHLEGGITSGDADIKNIRELARGMAKIGIADKIMFGVNDLNKVSFNPFRSFMVAQNWFIYGNFYKVYLWHKLTKVFPFYNHSHIDKFSINEFVDYLAKIFDNQFTELSTDTTSFLEFSLNKDASDEYSNYIRKCDEFLKSRFSTELEKMLQKLKISSEDWFSELS
jgi:hypothetical protein